MPHETETLLRSSPKKRAAVSEVLGSLIMVAITLTAGAAVFGFVNGQTGSSANAVGVNAARNINFLNEKEVVIYAAISGASPSTSANIWVYNYGSLNPMTITNVLVFKGPTQATGCTWTTPTIPQNQVVQFSGSGCTVSGSPAFATGSSYTFLVTGQFGSTAQITVGF